MTIKKLFFLFLLFGLTPLPPAQASDIDIEEARSEEAMRTSRFHISCPDFTEIAHNAKRRVKRAGPYIGIGVLVLGGLTLSGWLIFESQTCGDLCYLILDCPRRCY